MSQRERNKNRHRKKKSLDLVIKTYVTTFGDEIEVELRRIKKQRDERVRTAHHLGALKTFLPLSPLLYL